MSTLYSTASTKVRRDLDLEDEEFIQDAELLEYFNEAKREAAKEISTIYEDYFLDSAFLSLVLGTSKYNLPSGILAQKIRGVIYNNGSNIYAIKRIRTQQEFLDRAFLIDANPSDYYAYIIFNNATTGIQMELVPAAKETSSQNVRVFFIRTATAIVADSDPVDGDMSESLDFIYAFVKMRCLTKENAGVCPEDALRAMEMQKKLMIDTLTNRVPDDDNKVIMNFDFYEEMS